MLCPKCQTQNNEDAIFCSQCGESLRESAINNLELRLKRKKFVKQLILATSALIFVSGCVFAFINWHGTIEKPESVLKRMEKKMEKLKTIVIDNNYKIAINFSDNFMLGNFPIQLNFDLLNKIDQKNKRNQSNMELSYNVLGMEVKTIVETRSLDKKFYFNLKSIPPLLSLITEYTGDIKDKWVKIDEQSIDKLNELNKNFLEEEKLPYDLEAWKNFLDHVDDNNFFYKASFYEVLKKEKDEKVLGKMAHHYKVKINKKELADFLTANLKEEKKAPVYNFFNNIGEIEADIWVGRLNDLLYKVSLKGDINLKDLDKILENDSNQEEQNENYGLKNINTNNYLSQATGSYEAEIIFDNFNKSLKVEEPTQAIAIEDFYQNLFKKLEAEREKAKSATTLSNIKQIQTALELYYTDNNMYPKSEPNAVLGEGNYICLDSSGFRGAQDCKYDAYMRKISKDENGGHYIYNSIGSDSYLIKYEVKGDADNYCKKGKMVASPGDVCYAINNDTDNDGLSDKEEEYYKTNKNNQDTDGDGYLDGQEINTGYCPLKARIKMSDVSCFSSENGPINIIGSLGTFKKVSNEICKEGSKPIIRLFSTGTCPHCQWIKDTYDKVAKEYVSKGKIKAYHWEIDKNDDALTDTKESHIPQSELEALKRFDPEGYVPTFIFGCKYFRIGTGYEKENDLKKEENDFRMVIDDLLK